MDELGEKVEVVLGLLLVHLLHLLLHVRQLLEGGGQLGVVLGAAQQTEALAELVGLAGETFPAQEWRLSPDLQEQILQT